MNTSANLEAAHFDAVSSRLQCAQTSFIVLAMRTMFATGKAVADLGIGVETPQRWDREALLKVERIGAGRRALEDLNVCGMSKNRALAGSVRDGGWHEICRQLQYKAAMRGGRIAIADRFFLSSKTRSDCSCVKHTMPLSVGFWSCGECAMVQSVTQEAARNLQRLGLAKAEVTRGDIRPLRADANVLASAVVKPRT